MKKLIVIFLLLFTVTCYAETKVYYSPKGGARDAIIDCINKAENEIKIAMYSFTDPVILEALEKANRKQIKIYLILDYLQSKGRYALTEKLDEFCIMKIMRGINGGIMHHKMIIVDDNYYITGSYNYTTGAYKKNYENVIVIDDKDIVARVQAYYKWLWRGGIRGE